jgi:Tfp pilus assembly protein PilF
VKVSSRKSGSDSNAGGRFLQSQQPDKAMEDFKRWSELEPENADPLLLTVQVLSELDRVDEAVTVLNEALGKQPENSRLLSLRARLSSSINPAASQRLRPKSCSTKRWPMLMPRLQSGAPET